MAPAGQILHQVPVQLAYRHDRPGVLGAIGVYDQSAGITTVNGVLDASTRVDVRGGRLAGNGQVAGDVFNITGGTVGAGDNGAGQLSIVGDYGQDALSVLEVEIGGFVPGIQFDFLDVTGSALLDGLLDVVLDPLFTATTLAVGDTFTVLAAAGGVSGPFASLAVNLAGVEFAQIVGSNDLMLEVVRNDFQTGPPGVPEPATSALLALALGAAGWRARRRRGSRLSVAAAVGSVAEAAATRARTRSARRPPSSRV